MPKSLKIFLGLSALIFVAMLVDMAGPVRLATRVYRPFVGMGMQAVLTQLASLSGAAFECVTALTMLLLAGLAVRPRLRGARAIFIALTGYFALTGLLTQAYFVFGMHADFSEMGRAIAFMSGSDAMRFAPYVQLALPILQLSAIVLLIVGASRTWFETASPDTTAYENCTTMPLAVKLAAAACVVIVIGLTWEYFGKEAFVEHRLLASPYPQSAAVFLSRRLFLVLLIEKTAVILALGVLVAFFRLGWSRWMFMAVLGYFALQALITEGFVFPVIIDSFRTMPGLPLYAILTPYAILCTPVVSAVAVLLLMLPGSRAWFATARLGDHQAAGN